MTKRKRFQIFKRDSFTCGYCGRQPPEVTLEVDHVIPKCEGGGDDKDNLITSCFDCNRGKAGESLTVVPRTLADRTQRIEEGEAQYKAYQRAVRATKSRKTKEVTRVHIIFKAVFPDDELSRSSLRSVRMFIEKLGIEEVADSMDMACDRIAVSSGVWKYFCGTCWRKARRSRASS